jgi:hypothetical protein
VCHLQGTIAGQPLGLQVLRVDSETINGVRLHSTQVRGDIGLSVPSRARPTTGWTDVRIPNG